MMLDDLIFIPPQAPMLLSAMPAMAGLNPLSRVH